jgi:hypothetical protein
MRHYIILAAKWTKPTLEYRSYWMEHICIAMAGKCFSISELQLNCIKNDNKQNILGSQDS